MPSKKIEIPPPKKGIPIFGVAPRDPGKRPLEVWGYIQKVLGPLEGTPCMSFWYGSAIFCLV